MTYLTNVPQEPNVFNTLRYEKKLVCNDNVKLIGERG